MVTKPGIYDMDAETYHADPCETPSLSAGMINELLIAPAKCWNSSRRLNPHYEEPEDTGKFTIGSVSHVIFLEPHEFDAKVDVCDFADWRTKDAKAARDAAKAAGKTAILTHQLDKVNRARECFFSHPLTRAAFQHGKAEQSLFWRHPIYGFWCRARPDFIAESRVYLSDYKATANADPTNFGRHAYNMGYHRRAAWYLEGASVIFGARPEHYWFCNQEVKEPFLPSVVELNWSALEDGQAENDLAAGIFDQCLQNDDWYGYRDAADLTRDKAFQAGLPTWACMQIDQRLGRNDRPAAKAAERREFMADEYEGVE